jgi:hypothetical protein
MILYAFVASCQNHHPKLLCIECAYCQGFLQQGPAEASVIEGMPVVVHYYNTEPLALVMDFVGSAAAQQQEPLLLAVANNSALAALEQDDT